MGDKKPIRTRTSSLEEVKTQLENGEFAALKKSYFTCDKEFDKSNERLFTRPVENNK